MKKIIKQIILEFILIITFIPAYFLKINNLFFLKCNIKRIGHLVVDLTGYFEITERKNKYYLVIAPNSKIANRYIKNYLSKKIIFIENEIICFILKPLLFNPICTIDLAQYSESPELSLAIEVENKCFRKNKTLTLADTEIGIKKLKDLGVRETDWFVCFHARGSEYTIKRDRGKGGAVDYGQSFRNSNIADYYLAMNEVVSRGGKCIRMGGNSMVPIELKPNIIDYANSSAREDLLDIVLCASTKLFFGCESGLLAVASLFGTPICKVNSAPLSHTFPGFGFSNIGIPKLIKDMESGKILSFAETFELGVGNFRDENALFNTKYALIDNTPEDIRDLLIEGLDRLDNKFTDNDEDIYMQNKVKEIFLKYDTYNFNKHSLIGTNFLRRYKNIIF